MVALDDLVRKVDLLLHPDRFKDYCPNGLQIQGRTEVRKLVTGVTASLDFIEQAIANQACAVLVHHGCLWHDDPIAIVGMKYHRIKALMDADISLLAYHLPLDAHPKYGNNAQLARLLDITVTGKLEPDNPTNIGFVGRLAKPILATDFALKLEHQLKHTPTHIAVAKPQIETIAWCSGAAQNYFKHAIKIGVDAYLSGEISEQTTHEARENNIHYFAAGHHATEREGARAVGNYLADCFGIEHQFIEIDNPA